MTSKKSHKRIPPEAYNKAYLFSDYLEGYEEYKEGSLSFIKAKVLDMLVLEKGITLLEVGIGRGEMLCHCAQQEAQVTGIDYSRDVVEVARETLRAFPGAKIFLADCTKIPLESDSFLRVFAQDVIEHLCYDDAVMMLKDMYRVLQPGGFMLIHTAPNTIFTRLSYPLVRSLIRLMNRDIVEKLDYHLLLGRKLHIYEHNIFTLRRIAKDAGLVNAEVWMDEDILRSGKHRFTHGLNGNPLVGLAGSCGRYSLIRYLLGNDLYLKCRKEARRPAA